MMLQPLLLQATSPHVRWPVGLGVFAITATLAACSTQSPPPTQRLTLEQLDRQYAQVCKQGCPSSTGLHEAPIADFWRQFQDPILNDLVAQALLANTDIKIAQSRLRQARAQVDGVQAATLPILGTNAGIARNDPQGPDPSQTEGSIGGSIHWDIDFFGRSRAAREEAAAFASAAQAGIGAAQRLISAEVASSYLTLRTLQQRQRVTQAAIANQRETLRIVRVRNTLGRGTLLDVKRAELLLDNTQATQPALQLASEQATYRLATLLAQSPGSLSARMEAPQPLPQLPFTRLSDLATGTPERLLERRPDIRVAWQQVQAAHANTDLARSAYFPRFSLSGALGFTSSSLSDWGNAESRSLNAGAFISWNPFDFGRIRAQIKGSEARAEQALLTYTRTVQLAIEETESALARYSSSTQQLSLLTQAQLSATEAARLAQLRFDAGATDFLSVLEAQRSLLQSQDSLVQSQGATVTALVSIYLALGGGWLERNDNH